LTEKTFIELNGGNHMLNGNKVKFMKLTGAVSVIVGLFLLLLPSLLALAGTIGGNEIKARSTRDGVGGTTYIDMTHTILSDSVLSGWNIWAQSYAVNWPASSDPRSVKLIIFRSNNASLDVVGKSDLETVQEWDRAYHFNLTNPIIVKTGDFIGWYDAEGVPVPGGTISFEWATPGSSLTRWASGVELSGSTALSSLYPGDDRIYSINVEGASAPLMAPASPTGVTPTSGSVQVTIGWTGVSGATSYNLYYSTIPGVTKANGTKIAGVTSPYTISPLTNGTPYYFVVTAVNAVDESAESDQVSAVPNATTGGYYPADLAGNWEGNGLASGNGAPWWERSSIIISGSGEITGTSTNSDEETEYPSGTFNITSSGIITVQGNAILQCAMDAGKSVFACTDTWTSGSPGTTEMKVFVKKGVSYAQSDLTGTWEMNQLGTPGTHWMRGTYNIDQYGSFSGPVIDNNSSSATLSGTAIIASTGKINLSIPSINSTAECTMDADKTVFACTETDTTHNESIMSIYVKKSTSYIQADLPGIWQINTLISPTAWWGRVPLTINTNGTFSGTLTGSDGDHEALSGTFSFSNGVATGPFRCTMDAGKTVMACTGTGSEGDSNLMIAAKQVQPSAKTLSGLAVSSGPASVNEGGGSTYGATAYWSDGSSNTVTTVWSVAPTTYASINSGSGALTTVAVSGNQSVTVTASYTSGGITLIANRKVTIVDLQDTLTVTINGTGVGSVNSIPSGIIACTYPPFDGTCSTTRANGTSLTLAASPGGDSLFSGWSGACTNSVGNCIVALDANKTVTATFTTSPLAMIGTTPYDTLSAAYSAAAESGSVIMLKEGDPGASLGTLTTNAEKSVTIHGGYNAAYSSHSGSTIILGPVNLGLGSVILDNVGVK
jgi:hypothetical protein